MSLPSPYTIYKRYRTLQTSRISSLPVVILMPHSACNCRCVMCDIWKGNHNLTQLQEADITGLLQALKKYGTRQVLMSGGEALLNPHFFRFCEILKEQGISITLLSTGLTIKKHARQLVNYMDAVIVSLDGAPALHNEIRNLPAAFEKMKEGIDALRSIDPAYKVSGRTVIHRLNFRQWPAIVDTAHELVLNSISFLPADVSSQAFNREQPWRPDRQQEIALFKNELPELQAVIDKLFLTHHHDFTSRFIVESRLKIQQVHDYYAAINGLCAYPYKKCNAPWVSAVIEADGTVRPCFFHAGYGNIRQASLDEIVNSAAAIAFRKNLDIDNNDTCKKCVCHLNLSPGRQPS